MIDEKVVYGGLSGEERKAKAVQYWAYHIYRDLVALANRLHDAKKELKAGELGVIGELDAANLVAQVKEIKDLGE